MQQCIARDEFPCDKSSVRYEKVYRPIEVDELSALKEKTRKLDMHQKKVVEIEYKNALSCNKQL